MTEGRGGARLAFKLMRGFQAATTAEPRGATRKQRSLYRFETIHTLRGFFIR